MTVFERLHMPSRGGPRRPQQQPSGMSLVGRVDRQGRRAPPIEPLRVPNVPSDCELFAAGGDQCSTGCCGHSMRGR
jgi:hypothetical protein